MSVKKTVEKVVREFKLTTLALKNKNTVPPAQLKLYKFMTDFCYRSN